jgi:hypothetical protein
MSHALTSYVDYELRWRQRCLFARLLGHKGVGHWDYHNHKSVIPTLYYTILYQSLGEITIRETLILGFEKPDLFVRVFGLLLT